MECCDKWWYHAVTSAEAVLALLGKEAITISTCWEGVECACSSGPDDGFWTRSR